MGFFQDHIVSQLADVIEWEQYNDDMLFWKWSNKEIKKGSKLILRPSQDAIFMYNGGIEGTFKESGSYDVESQILPFLSTLAGFKFGFKTSLRAEVLFVNTKQVTLNWGTKQPINIPSLQLPGGIPIRAMGTFSFKISEDQTIFIEEIAGIKQQFSKNDVKDRVSSMLNQLLMKWIVREGKDMTNLQANAYDIAAGICIDLAGDLKKIGLDASQFTIDSFSYPEEIQKMIIKVASQGMIGDVGRYQQVNMGDAVVGSIESGKILGGGGSGSSGGNGGGNGGVAGDMMNMQMGMMMGQQVGQQMVNSMRQMQGQQPMQGGQQPVQGQQPVPVQQPMQEEQQPVQSAVAGQGPKFCPECGAKTTGTKFCAECGNKLI